MKRAILIIEDNDDDVIIIKRGFRSAKVANPIYRVTNGKEALDFFDIQDSSNVELMILDHNMEIMNGFDFLGKRQENEKLKKIPVVVLTSSGRQIDIEKAYNLGANAYVEKPLKPNDFIDAIKSITDFWICLAKKAF